MLQGIETMRGVSPNFASSVEPRSRAAALFDQQQREIFEWTSRLFAPLMIFQWLAGIAAAIWISPKTWAGPTSEIHIHVWAAIFLGGAIALPPAFLAWMRPADTITRHLVAIGQMLTSALLIHLSGGRIETHFHVFGSLAFLAFYRDWRVLLSASTVVAADHLLRGMYWPESVYGVLAIEPWRWVEHAGWVVFEDFFLTISILQGIREMRLIAERQANLESLNESVERQVVEIRRETSFVRLLQRIAVASNEARSVDDAMATALDEVCAITGWPVGHAYLVATDGSGDLIPSSVWHVGDGARLRGVRAQTVATRVPVGVGLPGRVAASGEPVWVRDVEQCEGLSAAGVETAAGIRGAFGCPVLVQKEVVAVLEFFSADVVDPDETLLQVIGHIGAQIGRVLERQRAQEGLTAFAAKLQRSNRELHDFAYVASHDLQEPLRKIQAFGDRLKLRCAEALGDQGRDYLERMQNAARRMSVLITDLLAFSRVTTKAEPFVPVDLSQIAREVMGDLEVRIEQTGGRVEMDELPTIDADPLQMRQLLQNLVGNGLKFHPPDVPPVVKISAAVMSDGRTGGSPTPVELCQIRVEDRGIGFDEKYLDRIFNVFQRLHGRGEYEGTGIGLAICRKIAERHGGSITAESEPGKGAAFLVTLPLKQTEGVN